MKLLDELDALHADATPPPWEAAVEPGAKGTQRVLLGCTERGYWKDLGRIFNPQHSALTRGEAVSNADMLAALRNAYPLLARLIRAQEALIHTREINEYDDSALGEYEAALKACQEA